ncbi:MAG: DUF5103 domain-containing protein [Flavobacteriales bacterium]|nr:DUF5103 domain-containing protein [Flavobacteriales bacterium]
MNKTAQRHSISLLSFISASIFLFSCGTTSNITTISTESDSTEVIIAEEVDYFESNILSYENKIYKDSINTIQLAPRGNQFGFPIINLNTDDRLMLSFDYLSDEPKIYNYQLVHCDSKWNPSGISSMEYIDGFENGDITDYEFSFNTIQEYIHYSLQFPSLNMKIVVSGNYIIKVFEDYNPDNVVFTMRFLVVDNKIAIAPKLKRATQILQREYKQEIDFRLDRGSYRIDDPFQDLKIVILQNGRWDNAIRGLQPTFINDKELIYDYDEENVFIGGNEFRFFDMKSFRYRTQHVKENLFDTINHVILNRDIKRTFGTYSSTPDINGKYLIKVQEGTDNNIHPDYAWVNFSLAYDEPIADGNLYVFGELSNWNYDSKYRLEYNIATKAYEKSIFLKQGYYNYAYMFLKDGETAGDMGFIEGTHFVTNNEYMILIYHRTLSDDYDKLIGYKIFKSSRF